MYLNEENKTLAQTFDDEARFFYSFEKICKNGFFIGLYKPLITKFIPQGYKSCLPLLFFQLKLLKLSKNIYILKMLFLAPMFTQLQKL